MIEINKKGKVKIHWKVSPYDYSPEQVKEIIAEFAQKYHLPKDSIRVVADFITIDESGNTVSMVEGVIDNLQDPAFMVQLFKDYIHENKVENCNFSIIEKIDKEINEKIDFQKSESTVKNFKLKWIKWSNFQSYGENNYFDFESLNGMVLLNGQPANQSGKTTLAVDLLHFLLFGKSDKAKINEDIFNKNLPQATNVEVEGCIQIEGVDYIINRTLTRPKLDKRSSKSKVTQKVEYYRVVGDNKESLEEYVELENGSDTRSTNKIIKESIGREDDFNLMMCLTGSNLDDLINEKPTERGRLLARWIGLNVIEKKDEYAREKFNQSIKPSLVSNMYDKVTLQQEIEAYKEEISRLGKENQEKKDKITKLNSEITEADAEKKNLYSAKQNIDEDVLKIDITTVNQSIENKKNDGVNLKIQLYSVVEEIKNIGVVDFSVDEYDKMVEERNKKMLQQQETRLSAKNLQELIKNLENGEFCPTCGKKLDNVDNSAKIAENKIKLTKLVEKGVQTKNEIEALDEVINELKDKREKYNSLNTLLNKKPILELQLERLRSEWKELANQINEYKKNSEAIDKNNKLDILINNADVKIRDIQNTIETFQQNITENDTLCKQYAVEITNRETLIKKLDEESILIYHWKLYLEMVGKNGISKMVMRKALPIINARLTQLLEDVCDFDVNVSINSKNEVSFNMVRDGIISDINSGSGFEKTTSALALRSVLADISNIPRLQFFVVDEVMGRVAKENYDKIGLVFDRLINGYDFIINITHLDDIKDWHKHFITITKNENGVSVIKKTKES